MSEEIALDDDAGMPLRRRGTHCGSEVEPVDFALPNHGRQLSEIVLRNRRFIPATARRSSGVGSTA